MKDSGRLAAMLIVAYFCIAVGLTGKLGSLLGSIIDPGNMTEGTDQKGTGTADTSGSGTADTSGSGTLPTSGTLDASQIGQFAIKAGFPANQLVNAIAIALAESGGNIGATHKNTDGSTDRGLWQINSVHTQYNASKLLTPLYNAQAAYGISGAGSNWNPWTTYTSGAYTQFLSQAQQGATDAALATVGV